MKVLITGATGFLGKHLLAYLLGRNYHVLIAKRASTNMDPLFHQFGNLEAWDIEGDEFENIFHTHSDIDAIIHAATDYGRVDKRLTATFWANEVFPIKLIELAIKYNIALFVNMDTFFNSNKIIYDYLGAYTLSKRHFQEWGFYCATAGRINFVNLRLFHLYGPGDGLQKFVPAIVKRCLTRDEIDLTDGKQKRDFVHIDDAVLAIGLVLEAELGRGQGYQHYDIGTGTSISIRDFVEVVHRGCSSGAKLNFGALPVRKGEFKDSYADINALRVLGWEAKIGIEMGIETVIKDVSGLGSLN